MHAEDAPSGDVLRVRVPYAARYDSMGWGKRPRAHFVDGKGKPRRGMEIVRGPEGISAIDEDGEIHRPKHGAFTSWDPSTSTSSSSGLPLPKFSPMNKAVVGPSDRWITVHPNGADEKGVPILIRQNPDGSHRVIGGAGGKLNHLRLHSVKTKQEYAADQSKKDKDKAAKQKARKEGLTPEQGAKEEKSKKEIKTAKVDAERAFVKSVREKMGGVSEDLDESKFPSDMSDTVKNRLRSVHHRKQLREALKSSDAALSATAEEQADEQEGVARIAAAISEDPVAHQEARDMADKEFALQAEEEKERKAERASRGGRTRSRVKASEEATGPMIDAIVKAKDPAEDLKKLGGRTEGEPLSMSPAKASDEVKRRAAEAMDNAKRIVGAIGGDGDPDATTKRVVAKALEAAGIPANTPTDDPEATAALAAEATRWAQRAELAQVKADTLAKMESQPGGELKAKNALAYTDTLSKVATSAAEARKLGLIDAPSAPVTAVDLAAMRDVISSREALRAAQKEFKAVTKAVESGDYDRSRRAFNLEVTAAPERVEQQIEDKMRTALAQRLLGVADPNRPEHITAVVNGHFQRLADVGLSIGGARHVDRAVMDAVGLKNSAILQRFALERDGHSPEVMLSAMEKYHVASQVEQTTAALAKVEKLLPGLQSEVGDVGSMEAALSKLDAVDETVGETQRVIGAALGSMEASATFGQTLRDKMPTHLEVGGDAAPIAQTLAWLHAAGLQPGDYSVDGKKVQIPQESWHKMVRETSHDDLKMRKHVEAIKQGKHDEDNWLPPGFVQRAADTFNKPVPNAPRYHEPFNVGDGDYANAIMRHVGSRVAEGEPPSGILPDMLSPKIVDSVPDREGYLAALREAFPVHDEDGKNVDYNTRMPHFQGMADKYMASKYGDKAQPLHAQSIDTDHPGTREALFRTLAEDPAAVAAFKPSGTLSQDEQRALRDEFVKQSADAFKKAPATAEELITAVRNLGSRPSEDVDPGLFGGGSMDMFGKAAGSGKAAAEHDTASNLIKGQYTREVFLAAVDAWSKRPRPPEDDRAAEHDRVFQFLNDSAANAPTAWSEYVRVQGGAQGAYESLQDTVKDRATAKFREHYGKITGKALHMGVQPITNAERHLVATDPKTAEEFQKARAKLLSQLRQRDHGGKYAGELQDMVQKVNEEQQAARAAAQQQGAMFGQATMFGGGGAKPSAPPLAKPKVGERNTLGERTENQLASLVGTVGSQIDPKSGPTKLFAGMSMSGKNAPQQRAIKILDHNGGRLNGFLGTGSGKTGTAIGSFTDQHAKGKSQHMLGLVPVAVQGQFGEEMLRFTEPGKYKWQTGDGMSHEQRVDMLKNPDVHMRVMTHQSFRDTALKLLADHRGVSREQMRADLLGSKTEERAGWWKGVREAHDIPPHFVYVDESQSTTEREGTDPSLLNLINTAVSHPMNATGYLGGSGTPHKNDSSEVWSQAGMVDPKNYGDRAHFMQQYGEDTDLNPDAVRRELAHCSYTQKVEPQGVQRTDIDNPTIDKDGRFTSTGDPIELKGAHKALVDKVHAAYDKAKKARTKGGCDVESIKQLAPKETFEGVDPKDEEKVAREWQGRSIGLNRSWATRHAINLAPAEINEKLQRTGDMVAHAIKQEWTDTKGVKRKGRQSVVFSDSTEECHHVAEHLKSKGLRVGVYHGGLNTKQRDEIRNGFQADKPKYDVIVGNSSMEAGVNLQKASVVVHYDVPQTAKAHQQRSARAHRQGQENPDVTIANMHTNDKSEVDALRRLQHKRGLADVFESPIDNLDQTGIAGAYHESQSERYEHADPDAMQMAAK